MRGSGPTPSAIADYAMPGYQAATELLRELHRTAHRIGGDGHELGRILLDTATRTFLATGEAGARVSPARRGWFYHEAWAGTHDCTGLLRAARGLRLLPTVAALAEDAVIRRTQQEVTIAMGVMANRAAADD